jgi:DNA-binding NarL/FixJ family response regulator
MAPKSDVVKPATQAPSVFAGEIEGFTAHSRLSKRESDIVMALIRNVTNSEDIAQTLGISTHTVNNHLKSIFEKTNTKSKTEILSSFLRYAADKLQNRGLFVRKPRVLIIDDEAMICEYVRNGLAERGIKTYSLMDPSQAVETISKFNIDFVVCDLRMPTMDGMEVLKAVRKAYQVWPYFMFITGYPDYSTEDCMHYGAAGFIEKPIDLDKLFRMIMEYLVESKEEKDELLQLGDASKVVIDEVMQVKRSEMGFGGAFIPMDAAQQKKHKLAVGNVVEVRIQPDKAAESLKVRGLVVWKRVAREEGLKAGVGVKFLHMGERDQYIYEDYVRVNGITSFIPRGTADDSTAAAG